MGHPSIHLEPTGFKRIVAAEATISSKIIQNVPASAAAYLRGTDRGLVIERGGFEETYRITLPATFVAPDLSAAVPWPDLLAVARLIKAPYPMEVAVEVDDDTVVVRQGRFWWNIERLDTDLPSLLPTHPDVSHAITLTRSSRFDLARAVRCVAPFAADAGDTAPVLEGLLLEHNQERQTLKVAATDRYVLAVETLWHKSAKDLPDCSKILPASWLKPAVAALEKDQLYGQATLTGLDGDDTTMVWLALEDSLEWGASGSLHLGVRPIPGSFPQHDRLIPAGYQDTHRKIEVQSAAALAGALRGIGKTTAVRLAAGDTTMVAYYEAGGLNLDRMARGVGDDVPSITVNVGKLTTALKAFEDLQVDLWLSTPDKPMVVDSPYRAGLRCLVMPIKDERNRA